MSAPVKGTDPKAMLQELKTNRRVQVALVALALMVWYLWPASAPAPARPGAARRTLQPLGDRQTRDLAKLPDLDKLDKAGELPTDARMLRDLFMFEGPVEPPPPPPPVRYVPPPEPTEAEKEAARLTQDKAGQANLRPGDLRFLGYLGTVKSGRLGAFMKGDEPITIKEGTLVNPTWRLAKVTEASAEFQNTKYPELRHRIDAVETRGAAGPGVANDY